MIYQKVNWLFRHNKFDLNYIILLILLLFNRMSLRRIPSYIRGVQSAERLVQYIGHNIQRL